MGESVGDAHVDIHANTDPFEPELNKGLGKATKDAEKLLDTAGQSMGETLADSTSKELGKHGKDFTGAIEDGIKKNRIKIDGEWFTIDSGGRLHNSAGRFARNLGDKMTDEVAAAFKSASGSGGIFNKIGTAISDAIGAGFNVSGKSPLIVALIPAIGALVNLVFGAVQAVNGLGAALVAVPGLITAIGLQIGTIAIAVDGVGDAMTNAFAATNATELAEAVKGLTPSAQAFVKSMIPVRDMFKDLKRDVQEGFFAGLGGSIAPMLRSLIELTKGPFANLARALGQFFAQLAAFFDSKVFANFVLQVFPATVRWLQSFGPVFVRLLEALTMMATVAIPFMEKLGGLLNKVFIKFTNKLTAAIEDGSLAAWLDRMLVTLEKVGSVFGSIIEFVFSFISAVDKAGGNKSLDSIAEFFSRLAFFLSSPVGIEALEGLINFVIILTEIFGGLLIVIGLVFAAFQFAAEAIGAFLDWLINTAAPAIGNFFTVTIPQFLADLWFKVQMFFADMAAGFWSLVGKIVRFFGDLVEGAKVKWNEFVAWIKAIPGRILAALANLGRLLWDAGWKIITGLWDGMVAKWNEAKAWLGGLAGEITGLKGPIDVDKVLLIPAGEAIIGGLEKGMRSRIPAVLGLAAGLTDTIASLNSMPGLGINVPKMDAMSLTATQVVNLNMGGMQFDGVPSESQAKTAGKAAAGGAMGQIQQRDTRLAVRML